MRPPGALPRRGQWGSGSKGTGRSGVLWEKRTRRPGPEAEEPAGGFAVGPASSGWRFRWPL